MAERPTQTSLLGYRTYRVSPTRQALLHFMVEALESQGCRILATSPERQAPFRIAFETALGERLGIVAYAFTANMRITKNRPEDEWRFQVKYGSKTEEMHELWQDPFGLYTTLFLGIDPHTGIFVAADPVLHSPTKFFISVEFKDEEVRRVKRNGWHAWTRDRRTREGFDEPSEVLVGGTARHFLRYVRFEREAAGEDPGHRQLIAERLAGVRRIELPPALSLTDAATPSPTRLHALSQELQLTEREVLDLISQAPRLKMAVRGWAAEEHLYRQLRQYPGVSACERIEAEGGADIQLRYRRSPVLNIEVKNVLRKPPKKAGLARVDFQRTRASQSDPCSRYYSPADFEVLAACLHAVQERWTFRYTTTAQMAPHDRCPQKLANRVVVDEGWPEDPGPVLAAAARALSDR